MTVDNEKKLDSYLAYIKGELITNFTDEESIKFIEWSKKIIADTIKDRKEKEILKQLKTCNAADALKLKQKKRKYLPINYPYDLHLGDVVYVNFGFGYCSELSDGHYGIILSEIKANMYLVLPLSSEPLKIFESYLDGLNLPNKNAVGNEKKSYLRFDQLRYLHYRRLENINGCSRKNIGETNLSEVFQQLYKFLKTGIDRY